MNIKTSPRKWFESIAFAVAFLPIALPAFAQDDSLTTELSDIQQSWDQANYQSANAEEKKRQLEALSARSEALVRKYPRRAEPLVWEGIVLSTYAGAKGGLGALSLAKKSRDCLLEATRIDPAALEARHSRVSARCTTRCRVGLSGSATRKRRPDFLNKALALNPDGMDPNYFLGELLFEQGEYARSLQHLQKALAAPPRPDRPVADAGRRAEIDMLVAKVRSKLQVSAIP